jgi:serine/threonine protein kinase/tetratricopeptide (TPR) repeat protein
MSACPSEEMLLELLDERLHGRELEELLIHTQVCPRCQDELAKLSGSDAWRTTVRRAFGQPDRGEAPPAPSNDTVDPGIANGLFGVPENGRVADELAAPSASTKLSMVDLSPADPYGTVSQSGPEAGAPRREPDLLRAVWPKVPGYQIMRRLGEGGMGVVYEARQVGLKRRVALKMIRGGPHARLDLVARFRIEAEAVARLRHPNIIQIFDIGEVEGVPFVSLELLEGGRLGDRLSGTPHPGVQSAELAATLALAIEAAHQAGIIHRDLKPTNVLFTGDGIPKVTDFGLAKRLDSEDGYTETGQVLGSPSYMAPEQAKGHVHEIGPAADVYALGAIVYEMLTGRPPFKGESRMETLRQVIADDPVAPSRLVPSVARDLETICLKCLSKDPSRRYPSAQALADDLGRYIRGEPIKARPISFWERGVKWVRRHPLKAAASMLVVALAAGLIVNRFDRERKLFARQTSGLFLLQKADLAQSYAALEKAQLELSEFLPAIEDEKRLETLASRIADKRKQIADRLDALQTEQVKKNRLSAERSRLEKFRKLRNEAQLYAARLMVVDPVEHQRFLRATALQALNVYCQEPQEPATTWSLIEPLPAALSPTEQGEVKKDCHDLLLMLAEAEAGEAGLKILDRAAQLQPATSLGYHLLRAICLARKNDAAGKAREEQLAAQLQPVSAYDHLLIGREQFARAERTGHGQPAPALVRQAIHSCQAAIRLDPEQLGARLLLTVIYFNSQRLSEAETNLDTCIRTAPDLLGLYLFRALVSGAEGAQALRKIQEAPARATEWKLEATDAFAAALEDYRRALELHPGPELRYVLLVNRGGMHLQAGRLEAAITDIEAAVKLNPKLYHAYAVLAQIRQRQGRLDEAALALDRAIERQPDRAELYRARGMLFVRADDNPAGKSSEISPGQRAAAIRDLGQCIRLEDKSSRQAADDHAERGRLLFAAGQTAEALGEYDAALAIVPDDLKATRLRALALLDLERHDDVLAACSAYLSRGKPSADLLEIRGQARLAHKDVGGAISDYTLALSLVPDSPALYNHRGWAYLFADAFKLALADFDKAIAVDPSLGHAYSGRGLARVSLGQWRDALTDAETALRLASEGQKQRAYFNAARVNALSLKYAADDVSRRGEAGLALYRRLRERVAALLLQSVKQLPSNRQDRFWREVVASDPVLRKFQPGPG